EIDLRARRLVDISDTEIQHIGRLALHRAGLIRLRSLLIVRQLDLRVEDGQVRAEAEWSEILSRLELASENVGAHRVRIADVVIRGVDDHPFDRSLEFLVEKARGENFTFSREPLPAEIAVVNARVGQVRI